MIILYYSGLIFFSFNIYSAYSHLARVNKNTLNFLSQGFPTGSPVALGQVGPRGTAGRQNTATDQRPLSHLHLRPGCQALSPAPAECDWPWKAGNNSDSSLSSATGAPKAQVT